MSAFRSNITKNKVNPRGLVVFFLSGLLTTSPLFAQTPAKSGDKSSLKSGLVNLEAASTETFRFSTSLHNGTPKAKLYDLHAQLPAGWAGVFRVMGSPVTAVNVEPGQSQEVTVELLARPDTKPAKYTVPFTATAPDENLSLSLEAVVKGAYGLELTTPTGRLSDDITEGSSKEVHLLVKNTGTLPLDNLELTAQTPTGWDVSFAPAKTSRLDPGKVTDVTATIKVPGKTIAGDYVTTLTAKNNNSTANATFRMTVKTSLLSGWFGMLTILGAVGLVFNLTRKYGRR
ncbi:COG1470 family protein [Arsenicibacter rosenii]|uniref:Alpha-galactosidase NEW3 domain-containing protein n=1 Tax=Arsenicibacter rosenii TaxID=1750698 RepID=A0A1S2VFQ8_9BACT|nr:NEW3 domain-containing protein [Arsenicibacter rosenii]OIN57046.1 hypothetical protein BLX24_22130 [Arsenicibacter rosenii]